MIAHVYESKMLFERLENSSRAVKNRSGEDLIQIMKKILNTEVNLDFLLKLNPRELEILAACIRNRMDQAENSL